MKTKKVVSIVLAIIMVLGLLPMSAIAQSDVIGKVIGNSFTDNNADPEKSYLYNVEGNDGSNQKISVLGSNTDTGNTMTKVATAGTVYYVRVNDYAVTGDNFLLVGEADGKNFAMNKNGKGSTQVTVENDPGLGEIIRGDYYNNQWKIETDRNGGESVYRRIINNDNDWLYIGSGGTGLDTNNAYTLELRSWGNNTFKLFYCEDQGWWANQGKFCCFYIDENGNVSGRNYTRGYGDSWENKVQGGTSFKWYQRREVVQDEYKIDTTALENLIALAAEREQYADTYTTASWNNFAAALATARQVVSENKAQEIYLGQAAANEALTRVVNAHIELQKMLNDLILDIGIGETVIPEIQWERTTETQDVVTGVQTIDTSDYSKIIWEWDRAYDNGRKIKDLPTDKVTTVWDYGTSNQISNAGKVNDVHAATWNKVGGGDWTVSSVRRFSGTFVWPHGYDFNDKTVIESRNDANYQGIYNYIDERPELKARYGDSKIFAVNDNMYVFISKADEQPSQWTEEEAMNHMVFWTGTDGKGRWTNNGTSADWGRTTPATFHGKAATPAFYWGWPNNGDIDGSTDSSSIGSIKDKMKFSDGWYSIVDTTATTSTLKGLYGVNDDFGGQKMRIDIFAFDNDGRGGMDEPILKISKPNADDVTVKINYWLDQVNGTSLGSSTKFTTDNAVINLTAGTNANELNYKRGEAVIKAGAGADVSNGVQQQENFVAHKGENNVIDVVYKSNVKDRTYLAYDFATSNLLKYVDTNPVAISSVSVEGIPGATARFVDHNIAISYTPEDSLGEVVNGTLIVNRTNNEQNAYPIGIIPASNVLYEENFMRTKAGTGAAWTKSGAAVNVTVADNDTSVFGYTNEYANNRGQNGVYSTVVTPTGNKRFADDLKFTFRGSGFDLIGSCGADSGTLVVSVRNRTTGKIVKNYMIDTSFNDPSLGTINQVPLLHCTGLAPETYDVIISGAYVDYGESSSRMSYSLKNALNRPTNNSPYDTLAEMGFTNEEIKDTEFINMEDGIASTFALKNDVPQAKSAPAAMNLAIDSIRVYRSSEGTSKAYPVNEQNITYSNILDAQSASFTAYMESLSNGTFGVADYRSNGGPANEIYLKPGTAIAIAVDSGISETQISVRAVNNGTKMKVNEGSELIDVNHNTEMYYKVAPQDGVIVIANKGSNMLAIDNVKCAVSEITDAQATRAVMMMTRMMDEVEKVTFVPQKFDVKLNVVNGLFNRFGTLRITASPDVNYVEINGIKTKADNIYLFNWGLAKNKKYITRKTVKKGAEIAFTIVAYDYDGNASDPIVISK